MPRHDDRHGNSTRLYVGHLSSRTRSRDLEDIFSRYGRVRDVDMKRDYAFVDFSDPRDADDARYAIDGRDVDGSRVIVEFAKGVPRGPGGSREYLGRGPAPGTGRCFNCGIEGHWARDCKAGDWKNKCYHCGDRGHIEKNCPNSPKKVRRGRSYSRSPSPHRGRSRSRSRGYSRSPSRRFNLNSFFCVLNIFYTDILSLTENRYEKPLLLMYKIREIIIYHNIGVKSPTVLEKIRSRSPPPKRDRSIERGEGGSRRRHRASPSPSKGRIHSPKAEERSPRKRGTPSPRDGRPASGSDYSRSPNRRNRSPKDDVEERSPVQENGRNSSFSPRDNGSPIDDDENHGSPRGSE